MFVFLNEDCWMAMKTLPDQSVDLVLTDPPYGITRNEWDKELDLERFWSEVERIAKPNAAILVFGREAFTAKLITSNPKHYRYSWTWFKNVATGFFNAKKMPLKATENISVFYRKLPVYNPQMRETDKPDYIRMHRRVSSSYNAGTPFRVSAQTGGVRYPIDVLSFPVVANGANARIHPTQKPVELLEYFIKTYSNEGDLVLDPFAGSCSCGHACLNTKRGFIGFEKDSNCYNLAKESFNAV